MIILMRISLKKSSKNSLHRTLERRKRERKVEIERSHRTEKILPPQRRMNHFGRKINLLKIMKVSSMNWKAKKWKGFARQKNNARKKTFPLPLLIVKSDCHRWDPFEDLIWQTAAALVTTRKGGYMLLLYRIFEHQQIDSATTTQWKLIESSKNWKINGQRHFCKQWNNRRRHRCRCHCCLTSPPVTKNKETRLTKKNWISTVCGGEVSWSVFAK